MIDSKVERMIPLKPKITLRNCYLHFKTITKHKLVVTTLCFKMGLIKQGIYHDLSKYSWIEFSSGARYYQGYRSPIDAEKEDIGYSQGWLHHKGRNKHHWEYWLDKNKNGVFAIEVPFNYVQEMVCDRIAACMIYRGKDYNQNIPLEYFLKGTDRLYMHPNTADLLEKMLTIVKDYPLPKAFERIQQLESDLCSKSS